MEEAAYQAIIKEMGKDIQQLKHNVMVQGKELEVLKRFVRKEIFPIVNELKG